MLVLRIFVSLYNDENADETFRIFREHRKSMRETDLSDPKLYGNEEAHRHVPTSTQQQAFLPIGPDMLQSLSSEKLREIMSIIFSSNAPQNNTTVIDLDGNNDNGRHSKGDRKFRLETALSFLQSYYSKAPKYSDDFEDDFEDAKTEFTTACRGNLAPDEAKQELFRFAVKGRALFINQLTQQKYLGVQCNPNFVTSLCHVQRKLKQARIWTLSISRQSERMKTLTVKHWIN